MKKITQLLILIGFVFGQPVLAQSRTDNRKAKKEAKIKEGKPMISPLACPAYTPELLKICPRTIGGGLRESMGFYFNFCEAF